MIAEECAPLAVIGDGGGLPKDPRDRSSISAAQGHEDARHERKMKGQLELVPLPQVGAHVLGPLVGLAQQDPSRVVLIDKAANFLEEGMRLRQVLAVGS